VDVSSQTKAVDAIAEALACSCDLFQRNPLLRRAARLRSGWAGRSHAGARAPGGVGAARGRRLPAGISFAEFPEFVHSHNWHDPKAVCAFADFLRSSAENRALTGKMRTALDTIRSAAGWFDEQRTTS